LKQLAAVLLWSVIAAAFIGPGTVATAASAGAAHRFALLWTLVFSTLACLVLQEASARLTVVSGQSLGQALRGRYAAGLQRWLVLGLVLGAIVLGCAAYEAGNIVGGVAGAVLATDLPTKPLALLASLLAAALLWSQAPRTVARVLSAVVAIMGIAFLVTAWRIQPSLAELLRGSLVPSLPPGSGTLVLGLIGTTVVPYNIFLGSGLAGGQELRSLRLGLAVAIGLGGLISMAVLVVGTAVPGSFAFEGLADILAARLGRWASTLFAIGLLGAGLSSAITAPLAAAVTARDLLAEGTGDPLWTPTSWRYRAVWSSVLASGLAFGLSDVQPIPVIIVAQALNGLLLPWVAIFLFLAVNDRRLMGESSNGWIANSVTAAVVLISLVLGVSAVARAVATALALPAPNPLQIAAISLLAAIFLGLYFLCLRSLRHR
jgi:Mn2+/Fe2+ NRAMP family transporter